MTLTLLGLGTALPGTAIRQEDALGIARRLVRPSPEQESWLPALYAGSGILTRHLALPAAVIRDVLDGTRHTGSPFLPTGEADARGPTTPQRMEHYARLAPPLALESSGRALASAGVAAHEVTHLVTVSCTGLAAPGVDRELIEGLGLPGTVERTNVGFMGCHAALNGLRVAAGLASNPASRVLLCATELCSLHYHYGWCPEKLVANALFADGSAAIVAAREGPAEAWRLSASGACLVPDSADAMTWVIGTHGFEMTLSRAVPGLIARYLRPFLQQWLGKQGMKVDEVRSWAVHPGGPRILAAAEEALGLPQEALSASREVLARCGNMSSPTLLFILDEMRRRGERPPCVALGFGPGLAVEAALFL
jgi:prepilin-type processing-associated H-X9-DG protein